MTNQLPVKEATSFQCNPIVSCCKIGMPFNIWEETARHLLDMEEEEAIFWLYWGGYLISRNIMGTYEYY